MCSCPTPTAEVVLYPPLTPQTKRTEFVGFPETDFKTAIDITGDYTQMEDRVELVGTQFGVGDPGIPMPNNLTLVNDGYTCPAATTKEKRTCYNNEFVIEIAKNCLEEIVS
ncbi:COBRA-LIKE PROTEIN 7 [Salix viminalis]|uniref:COBRA-LIKE PROTEIN 7 n=1 Tax=Salix viminalis TaxID=40686 RepID=A0A9Q0NS77_SALVM|nr:COBRA-LIKE PROTEIN 7 [Salix viminalis]